MTSKTSTNEQVRDFTVQRDDWANRKIVARSLQPLAEGEVLFRVDRYALTANNISYAAAGDSLGYWKFFPAEEGWGRLPCFAFANVERSNHPDVKVGDRYFGYFPMSTHLVVKADRVKTGSLVDGAEHRKQLAAAYNRYTNVAHDPAYQEQYEDAQMLLQPLFMTSFLVDDFFEENEFFGARSAIITSASSKTSIALAHQQKRRSLDSVVGLTSERNVAFVKGLGLYDEVHTYDAIESLDASIPSVVTDMAGNKDVIRRLHEHFGDNMKYNCVIGATHWDKGGRTKDLPGAKPQFFFAPMQIKKRSEDWGRDGLMQRIGEAWMPFVRGSDAWLKVRRGHGAEAILSAYDNVLNGRCAPSEGQVLSLWESERRS